MDLRLSVNFTLQLTNKGASLRSSGCSRGEVPGFVVGEWSLGKSPENGPRKRFLFSGKQWLLASKINSRYKRDDKIEVLKGVRVLPPNDLSLI